MKSYNQAQTKFTNKTTIWKTIVKYESDGMSLNVNKGRLGRTITQEHKTLKQYGKHWKELKEE